MLGLLAVSALFCAAPRAGETDAHAALEARRSAEESRLQKVQRDIEEMRERLLRTEAKAGSILDAIGSTPLVSQA